MYCNTGDIYEVEKNVFKSVKGQNKLKKDPPVTLTS